MGVQKVLGGLLGGGKKDNSAEILRQQQEAAEQRRLDESKAALDKQAQSSQKIAQSQSKRRAFVNSLALVDEDDPRRKFLQAV